jgi:hypothetical protein
VVRAESSCSRPCSPRLWPRGANTAAPAAAVAGTIGGVVRPPGALNELGRDNVTSGPVNLVGEPGVPESIDAHGPALYEGDRESHQYQGEDGCGHDHVDILTAGVGPAHRPRGPFRR